MGVAAAVVGAAVVGGVIQGQAAKSAAKTSAGAADRASQLQYEQFQETKEMLQPWEQGGLKAYQLQQDYTGANGADAQKAAYANYAESPGVQWAREQGMKGIAADSSMTGVGGGTRLKAISDYNQGLAMQDFSNQFNRLGAVTGVGANAASSLAGAGSSAAQGQAQTTMAAGNARAQGTIGRANAFSSGISNVANVYAMDQMGMFK